MPGAIATNLQRHTGGLRTPPERRKSPQQGAETSVPLATTPQLEGIGGRHFEDCNEAVPVSDGNGWAGGVASYVLVTANAERHVGGVSTIPVLTPSDTYSRSL
ncbi:hypothetical protein [Streptomyces sp. NPDC050528]|uniref:hypothetical protein n=1 Tax=Streptomyces sp. NPDC050528 TaxID=3365623 RepID=UPI0037974072